MQKWEYDVMSESELSESPYLHLEMGLNAMGLAGWELVAIHQPPTEISEARFFFKRVLED